LNLSCIERFKQIEWFKQVAVLRDFQTFGELALINNVPRSATVAALQDSEFAILKRSDYETTIIKN